MGFFPPIINIPAVGTAMILSVQPLYLQAQLLMWRELSTLFRQENEDLMCGSYIDAAQCVGV